jgi:pimeloyl-ACP methyl ester carboxylesterase
MDVCLVKMPFRLAFLGISKASDVMAQYDYENWYIGGHSLGGAMSAVYAADHGDKLRGVVLLAAYATKKLDDDLKEIVLYGSEDRVLNVGKIVEGRKFAPGTAGHYLERVIEGGNHALFGNYGKQEGDGEARITAQEQQERIVGLDPGFACQARRRSQQHPRCRMADHAHTLGSRRRTGRHGARMV